MRRPGMLCRVFSRAKWTMYNKESTEKEKRRPPWQEGRRGDATDWRSGGKKVARSREPRDGEEPPGRPTLDGEGAFNTAWWAAPYCNPIRSLAGTELGVTAAVMQRQHARKRGRAYHCSSVHPVRCGWMPSPIFYFLFSIFLLILWKASMIDCYSSGSTIGFSVLRDLVSFF